MNNSFYVGVVESRDDPLKLGRVQCRIVGQHTEDKSLLPTEDLPWAYILQPVTSGAMSGVGSAPVGPMPGTWVGIQFIDPDKQNPIVVGTFAGIPQYPKESGGSELLNEKQEQNFDVAENGSPSYDWDKYNKENDKFLLSFGSSSSMSLAPDTRNELELSEFLREVIL
jgi:hypothetical protein